MPTHIVKQGEHISNIAEKYGFALFETIWDDSQNSAIRNERKNPHVLLPGDSLFIPDRLEKKEPAATELRHRFQLKIQKLKLRVVVLNLDREPIANTECRLEIDGLVHELTSDGDGLIETKIPRTAKGGSLDIPPLDVKVPVHIGHLDPVTEVSGYRARLNNLGYFAGTSDDTNDQTLRSAIEEFQCDYGLTVDGDCGSQTQEKLMEVHGC